MTNFLERISYTPADLNIYLLSEPIDDKRVRIGNWGGRYVLLRFCDNEGWVGFKDIAKVFKKNTDLEKEANTKPCDQTRLTLLSIQKLDTLANEELAKQPRSIRFLTYIRSSFGLLTYWNWRKDLNYPIPSYIEENNIENNSHDLRLNLLRKYGYTVDSDFFQQYPEFRSISKEELFEPPLEKPSLVDYLKSCQLYPNIDLFKKHLNNKKQLEIISDFSTYWDKLEISNSEVYEKHIIRKKGFAIRNGYALVSSGQLSEELSQRLYGYALESAIQVTSKHIKDKTFEEVLNAICAMRSLIAYRTHSDDKKNFGMNTIEGTYFTYLNQDYLPLIDFFNIELVSSSYRVATKKSVKLRSNLRNYVDKVFDVVTKLDDEDIILSKIVFLKLTEEDIKNDQKVSGFTDFNHPFGILVHMDRDYLPKVMQHVSKLYSKVVNSNDRVEILKLCAHIFWWLSYVKFVARGDPSIAEILIKAICRSKGIDFPAWKEGLIPWVEVVKCFTAEEFEVRFLSLFDPLS